MIERSQERIDQTGEVFTPDELVKSMLDRLPPEIWFDPQKKWLEPTCGDGNFLITIFDRLMESLRTWEPNPQARHKHIIENMLFGVELMEDNAELCVSRLKAENLKHNIVCTDGLAYDYQFGRPSVDDSGLIEMPAQRLYKKSGRNAWYVKNSG